MNDVCEHSNAIAKLRQEAHLLAKCPKQRKEFLSAWRCVVAVLCAQLAALTGQPWWFACMPIVIWRRSWWVLLLLTAISYGRVVSVQPETLASVCSASKWSVPFSVEGVVVSAERTRRRFSQRLVVDGVLRCKSDTVSSLRMQVNAPLLPWLQVLSPGTYIYAEGRGSVTFAPRTEQLLDYKAYLYRRGLAAYVYASELSSDAPPQEQRRGLWEKHSVTLDEQSGGLAIILAVTRGRADALGEHLYFLFRDLGASHLLVISGFHVGVVCGLIALLVSLLWARSQLLLFYCPTKVVGLSFGLVAAFAYVCSIGFTQPTVRALVMLACVVGGEFVGRRAVRWRVLLLAFLIVITIYPGAFLEAGCQLSFAALGGIFAVEAFSKRFLRQDVSRGYRWIRETWLVCLGAWAATVPITLFWFGQTVLLAPVVNFFLVPLFSFVVIAGGGVAVLLAELGIPEPLLWLSIGADYILKVAEQLRGYVLYSRVVV